MNSSPEQAAGGLREQLSARRGRVDVVALARRLGCRVSTTRISIGGTVQADLCPDARRDLFYLRVDPQPAGGWEGTAEKARETIARHRLRFRVSHELGHTFFYERRKGAGPRRACHWSSREEEWCDEFARELLVPASVARTLPPSAASVFRLQRRFDVSLEVAARALASAHEDAAVAIWFWLPNDEQPQESLLQQWATCDTETLRAWRGSALVERALVEGESSGLLPGLEGVAAGPSATASCDQRRRQVVVVAT